MIRELFSQDITKLDHMWWRTLDTLQAEVPGICDQLQQCPTDQGEELFIAQTLLPAIEDWQGSLDKRKSEAFRAVSGARLLRGKEIDFSIPGIVR
jgi:hypothetical protein